jgi:hypothetical protein
MYLSSEYITQEDMQLIWPISLGTSCWLPYCNILLKLASPTLSQSFYLSVVFESSVSVGMPLENCVLLCDTYAKFPSYGNCSRKFRPKEPDTCVTIMMEIKKYMIEWHKLWTLQKVYV